ncbi:MAG: 4'-phosphopantetheinyl transferase superfamily protein [Proteobacteria bacterium]|jgi:4'-phosphopantetheinyl transferase EntD|nr:4'-phosphopantetheinyl transferase superfamily protein [Pseudomonadota bacterium]
MNEFPVLAIQNALMVPDLEISVSPIWNHAGRKALQDHFEQHSLPAWQSGHLSLSHTQEIGGYISCRSAFVGFDIETVSRAREELVLRISSTQEVQEAPSAAALWCAKEAVFKALLKLQQPKVLSQIKIIGWHKESQFETFQLRNADSFGIHFSRGLVFESAPHCFSFFVCRP